MSDSIRAACEKKTTQELLRALLCEHETYTDEGIQVIGECIAARIGDVGELVAQETKRVGLLDTTIVVQCFVQNPKLRGAKIPDARGVLHLASGGLGFVAHGKEIDSMTKIMRQSFGVAGRIDGWLDSVWAPLDMDGSDSTLPVSLLAELIPSSWWLDRSQVEAIEEVAGTIRILKGEIWSAQFALSNADAHASFVAWASAREIEIVDAQGQGMWKTVKRLFGGR